MALIECKDCKNQISDSAESCPKCGAPVAKTIGVDETQCPHCMTVISKKASTCPSCKAVKGYMYDSRFGVMGKTAVKFWHIILPISILILVASLSTQTPGWIYITCLGQRIRQGPGCSARHEPRQHHLRAPRITAPDDLGKGRGMALEQA